MKAILLLTLVLAASPLHAAQPPNIVVVLTADLTFDGEDISTTLLSKSETSRKAPLFCRRPPDRKRIDNQPLPDLAVRKSKWKLLCNINRSHPGAGGLRKFTISSQPYTPTPKTDSL